MHSPRPYGLSVTGGELSDRDRSFIDHEVKKLTNRKDVSALDGIRQVRDLPDGGYVILQDMGGILKAVVFKEQITGELRQDDGLAKLYVPMLFSGVIIKARVRQDDGVEFKITEQCRRRLINYSKDDDLPDKVLRLQRFVVQPNAYLVPEFIPRDVFGSDFITTQYVQQRPTWYSGAMAEVMQIVGGFGRQDVDDLPEQSLERVQFRIPTQYIARVADRLDGVRLPAYRGVPPLDGAFQFDYKFNGTNGVTFDTDNCPWLVRVASSGVWAMPLPLIPVTITPEFKQYVEDVGDEEILKILERFGGVPSGEGFPTGEGFQAWRRAGVVIKVCDTADFYAHIAYSQACGWSFNLRGTEGFNTCYTFDEDGIIVGKAYKIRLDFSPAVDRGWLKKIGIADNYNGRVLESYLKKLFALLEKNTAKTNAILYKLRRVSPDELYDRAEGSLYNPLGVNSNDVDYWDNFELEPIASLNGNVSLVAQGYLYSAERFKFQPQFKIPSVELGGCVSFDFSPLDRVAIPSGYIVRCDTIMYGYYVGNSLKVIKYFLDTRGYFKQVESNFEPVMTVGAWQQIETEGLSSPQGHFYTTDFDFREVFSPVVTKTTIKGEDKGFDSQPFFSFDYFFAMPGTLWRHRYFTHLTNTERTEYEAIKLAVCIPYFVRDAALLAKRNTVSGKERSESLKLHAMQDPTTYRYWTYDFVWAWSGGLEKMTGKPSPKDGSPVWVEIENYRPSEYSDFADQGSWLPNLPYDITWLIHPNRHEWRHSGGGGSPKVQEYFTSTAESGDVTGAVYLDLNDLPIQLHGNIPDERYFYASPSEFGDVFYRDACKVVFGDVEYANISETNAYGQRFKWGHSTLVEHKSAYHFIGVMNE